MQINDTQPGEIRLFRPNPTNLDESVNLQMEIISGQTYVGHVRVRVCVCLCGWVGVIGQSLPS